MPGDSDGKTGLGNFSLGCITKQQGTSMLHAMLRGPGEGGVTSCMLEAGACGTMPHLAVVGVGNGDCSTDGAVGGGKFWGRWRKKEGD